VFGVWCFEYEFEYASLSQKNLDCRARERQSELAKGCGRASEVSVVEGFGGHPCPSSSSSVVRV
jgi:hypothetical protein